MIEQKYYVNEQLNSCLGNFSFSEQKIIFFSILLITLVMEEDWFAGSEIMPEAVL